MCTVRAFVVIPESALQLLSLLALGITGWDNSALRVFLSFRGLKFRDTVEVSFFLGGGVSMFTYLKCSGCGVCAPGFRGFRPSGYTFRTWYYVQS